MTKANYIIGIDPGAHTGIAVWDRGKKELVFIKTMMIHQAMKFILEYSTEDILVRFEDARLRNWFGTAGREQLQGAGSIKRDCTIWEDFLKENGILYEAIPPRNNCTKLSSIQFKKITGYSEKTNEHGRDAAMLVYKF